MAEFQWYAMKLVIINVVIYVVQLLVPGFTDQFVLVSSDVLFRPWTLVTSMFLHASVTHLLYNMFALALFGSFLEKFVSSKKFLIAYFAGGLVASIGSVFFYNSILGASGAIFAIQGYLATIKPRMMMWVYGAPMPMFLAVLLWALLNFVGIFFPAGIAYASHLFGLGFGILFALFVHGFPKWDRSKKENYPPDEELDAWEERYMISDKQLS